MKHLAFIVAILMLAGSALAGSKSRIFTESNLTPVFGPSAYFNPATAPSATNPRWVQNQPSRDYLVGIGFDEFTMVYNGTLNRVGTWYGQPAATVANGQVLWTDPKTALSNEGNFCDPPDADAVSKVAALHKLNPYGGSKKLLMPICFDIENAPSINIDLNDSADTMDAKVARIKLALMVARSYQGGGPDTEVWWYGFPGAPGADPADNGRLAAIDRFYRSQQPLAEVVTGACCSFYNWDVPAASPTSWYAMPAAMDSVIARYYPGLRSKIAFVTPVYQIYWPANAPPGLAAKDGKPVEYAVWCAQIDYLVEHDWDIVVWMGSTRHEAVARHLQYVAKYRR